MQHSQRLIVQENDILTPREDQIAYWNALGKSNPEIGLILGVSPETVKTHLHHVGEKLQTYNRTSIVTESFRQGILKFVCLILFLCAQASIEINGFDAIRPRPPGKIRITRTTRGPRRPRRELFLHPTNAQELS